MANRSRKQQAARGGGGRTLNLPPQVYSKLSQEERYLQEQLAVLKREMYYSLVNTVQKQQVVGKKLVRLEHRVAKDKERTVAYSQRQVTVGSPPKSAPVFSQLRNKKLGASFRGWKSAPPAPRVKKAAPRTPMCIRPTKRWSTVEYFRDLLRPSVLVCKQGEVQDDITWVSVAERNKSAMAQGNESQGRPQSRAYTPSQWNTITATQQEDKPDKRYRRYSALHGK